MKEKPRAGFHEELQACPPGRFIWLECKSWNRNFVSGAIWGRVLNAKLRSLEFNLRKRQAQQPLSTGGAGVSSDKEWSWLV